MDTRGVPSQTRYACSSTLHICAFTVVVVAGTCAAVALIAGSPLEFGIAMALCAGWLVVVDFIESNLESQRAVSRREVPAAQRSPAYDSCRVVFGRGR